ncbi:RNA polymerase sigma factor [Sorangium sp. So ce1097]|uniref:RNA polymerase sigma factor n=1 Tax=Sorangium sp. So ce1097 TaxID=3133330 RepID=UPI003F5E6455
MLRLLGVAEADVDDLLQEILLSAYKSLDRFHPDWTPAHREAPSAADPSRLQGQRRRRSPEGRWVVGIALHKVSHHLRRAHRRREVPVGLDLVSQRQAVDPAPSGEEHLARRERLELATEVLDTLDPERRVLLVMYEAYEVPLVDIARELGLKYNTASNRLRLAREDYRAAVKRLRPEQRRALRAFWLPFPQASALLAQGHDAEPPVSPAQAPPSAALPASRPPAATPPAPSPPLAARSILRGGSTRIARALGWAAAGAAVAAAALLALTPPRPLWAYRFGVALRELPARGAVLAVTAPQRAPEPRAVAPAAEALDRPCRAAPRASPPAGEREDAFVAERRLLDAAQERLSAGDLAGALRQLATHEERFPLGRLMSVRERLRTLVRTRMAAPPARTAAPPTRTAAPPTRMAAPPARMAAPPTRIAAPPEQGAPGREPSR